jgi:hypothetical protein
VQIVGEIYAALERLDADEELLATVGGGTRSTTAKCCLLRDYNAGHTTLHRAQ